MKHTFAACPLLPVKPFPFLLFLLSMPMACLAENWPLDEVSDSLTVRGTAKTAAGASGQSLVLDGESLIELKDSAKLASGGFTISLWFNPYDLAGGQQMLAGKNRYSRNERQWSLTIEPDGRLKAHLRQGGWSTISCVEALKAGSWHFAALVLEADKAALFLNGKPVGEVPLKMPIAATQAPITLGGIRDAEHVRQAFSGALDECSVHSRALTAEEIAASYRPVLATHDLPRTAGLPLWDDAQVLPNPAELPQVAGAEFHVIKKQRPDTDGCNWTLGVGVAWHKGKLYASYGFNKGGENTASEEAHVRVSSDGGKTWATAPSNLPMATSKPYAGILSTGQRYLVCTTAADTGGGRSPLTIAVSKPRESVFSKVFLVRRSVFPEGPGVSAPNADFSYPYAVEHEGKLYIGYTHKSHAANELAVIPVESLETKP